MDIQQIKQIIFTRIGKNRNSYKHSQSDDNTGQKYNEKEKQRKITILYIINEISTQRHADCITFHCITSPPINDNNVTKRTVERKIKKLTIALR